MSPPGSGGGSSRKASNAMTVPVTYPASGIPAPQPSVTPSFPQLGMTANPAESVVVANDLVKVYGTTENPVVALNRVNVSFDRGTFTSIMGPSGSGKSTLMHCLAGLDRFEQGRVFLGGVELNTLMDKKLTITRRDKVGFIFQSFNLVPTMDAKQNILLPLSLAGRKPDMDFFNHLVESLGIEQRLKHRPSELSGGQQQRVAVARALITRPDVVFADEPTGALDTKASATLLAYLKHSSEEFGQTIIMVTHDPKAAAVTDRALILVDGQIVNELHHPTVDSVNAAMNEVE